MHHWKELVGYFQLFFLIDCWCLLLSVNFSTSDQDLILKWSKISINIKRRRLPRRKRRLILKVLNHVAHMFPKPKRIRKILKSGNLVRSKRWITSTPSNNLWKTNLCLMKLMMVDPQTLLKSSRKNSDRKL